MTDDPTASRGQDVDVAQIRVPLTDTDPATASDAGSVSGLVLRPADAWAFLVIGHGAGAGMRHSFMDGIAERLAARGVASLRYQFPYMEAGRKRPDRHPALLQTVRAACRSGVTQAGDLPMFAGGKSMGGRMTSTAQSESPLEGVKGLVFFGFPLHAPGRDSDERGEHLRSVRVPMLFLQGTRDRLARLDLLEPLLNGNDAATLHIVDGADHGFHVLQRSGRTDAEALDELADTTAAWLRDQLPA